MTTRRLAAILAADVAGLSASMEIDEEGTFARIRILRREVNQKSRRGYTKSFGISKRPPS